MDNFHTVRKRRKKKLEDLKAIVEIMKMKIEKSQLLEKEEREYLNFSIDYIIYIMDKYKNIEGLDI
jgi:hypothetical protein